VLSRPALAQQMPERDNESVEKNPKPNVSQDLNVLINNIKAGAGPKMTDRMQYYVLALLTTAQMLLS
jgi:hypothetical protein